ncbi:hypothetical protein ZOSMA_152G00100 [Zostera marina]|uniref:Uncharacterized protein n=1 Tax=Zostera marina TaxID=29655 RepID=A0A0K9PY69_ZOSMR|nr:hypothetical protein ZOSMA_152G00100 [Zostera marina]
MSSPCLSLSGVGVRVNLIFFITCQFNFFYYVSDFLLPLPWFSSSSVLGPVFLSHFPILSTVSSSSTFYFSILHLLPSTIFFYFSVYRFPALGLLGIPRLYELLAFSSIHQT